MTIRKSVLAVSLALTTGTFAQRVIYDPKTDRAAQDAAAAAKDMSSGSVFEKMLRNVDLEAKQEAETAMANVEQQMRAKLETFAVWNDPADKVAEMQQIGPNVAKVRSGTGVCKSVFCELNSLKVRLEFALGPPINDEAVQVRIAEFEKTKKLLEQALEELKKQANAPDPAVVRTFSLLEDNEKDAIDYARKIGDLTGNKGQAKALDEIGDGLNQVLSLYHSVRTIWEGYEAIDVDPASLRPPRQKLELQLVSLDEEHFNALTRIRARAQLEIGAALDRVETALNRLEAAGVGNSHDTVEKTLRDASQSHDREQLRKLLGGLHEAAAAVAQVDASGRIARLRESDEQRRYSIRRSSLNSSTYDFTIQAASQRLALYWKSGIKPAEVAQLMFYLTNTVAVPVIATK